MPTGKKGVHFDHHITAFDENSDIVKLICYTDRPITLDKGEDMIYVELPGKASFLFPEEDVEWLISEYYSEEKAIPLSLRTVKNEKTTEQKTVFTLAANPVSDVIRIKYSLQKDTEVKFVLRDISGKIIIQQPTLILPAGDDIYDIVTDKDLVSGMYVLQVFSDLLTTSFSIIKVE